MEDTVIINLYFDRSELSFHLGSYYVIIAGGRNSNVLIKIQESCLETEQSQLYFPHCMYSPCLLYTSSSGVNKDMISSKRPGRNWEFFFLAIKQCFYS